MPTYSVTAPPVTLLGLWVADTEHGAVDAALLAHPEYDALSGLRADLVSPVPPADNYAVWQTHGSDGQELGIRDGDGFHPRPLESFSTGDLSVAIDGIRLQEARGEAGFIRRESDGATMDLSGRWTPAEEAGGKADG